MRGNGLASKKVQIRCYKTNFTERVDSRWTKLLTEVAASPSLESLKSHLDVAYVGVWFRGDYGGVRLMIVVDDLEGLFQPL